MSGYKIFDKCFLDQDLTKDFCYHYVLMDNAYSVPILDSFRHKGDEIEDYTPELGCGNPWNNINPEYADHIRSSKPDRKTPLVSPNRPIMKMELFDRDNIKDYLDNSIHSDCWGIYIRNGETLEEIEVIFTTKYNPATGWEKTGNRDVDLDEMLDNLNDEIEFVVVMMNGSLDHYVRKIDDQYMLVNVE